MTIFKPIILVFEAKSCCDFLKLHFFWILAHFEEMNWNFLNGQKLTLKMQNCIFRVKRKFLSENNQIRIFSFHASFYLNYVKNYLHLNFLYSWFLFMYLQKKILLQFFCVEIDFLLHFSVVSVELKKGSSIFFFPQVIIT